MNGFQFFHTRQYVQSFHTVYVQKYVFFIHNAKFYKFLSLSLTHIVYNTIVLGIFIFQRVSTINRGLIYMELFHIHGEPRSPHGEPNPLYYIAPCSTWEIWIETHIYTYIIYRWVHVQSPQTYKTYT